MQNDNKQLATKIIEQKADITHNDMEYDFNLIDVLGRRFQVPKQVTGEKEGEVVKVTKAEAVEQAIDLLAGELDSGELDLAANWATNNLK